jgi:hypothetical protein
MAREAGFLFSSAFTVWLGLKVRAIQRRPVSSPFQSSSMLDARPRSAWRVLVRLAAELRSTMDRPRFL